MRHQKIAHVYNPFAQNNRYNSDCSDVLNIKLQYGHSVSFLSKRFLDSYAFISCKLHIMYKSAIIYFNSFFETMHKSSSKESIGPCKLITNMNCPRGANTCGTYIFIFIGPFIDNLLGNDFYPMFFSSIFTAKLFHMNNQVYSHSQLQDP